ncbi:MAG: hypothetical protein EOM11_10890 [Erysipelotrichia bacterium]|nr:hypothetical protein [Erysipelotrichia bacterium]
MRWDCPASNDFCNVEGPTVTVEIPEMDSDFFTLLVRVVDKPEYNSSYLLHFSGNNCKKVLPSGEYFRGETEFTYTKYYN